MCFKEQSKLKILAKKVRTCRVCTEGSCGRHVTYLLGKLRKISCLTCTISHIQLCMQVETSLATQVINCNYKW